MALVRFRQHDERVLVAVEESVALLGDDRGEQDVPGVADAHAFSSVVSSAAAAFLAGAFLAAALVAGAFFAAAFLAGASAAAAFLAGAFLAAAFFAGASAAVPASASAGATEGTASPGIRCVSRSGLAEPPDER